MSNLSHPRSPLRTLFMAVSVVVVFALSVVVVALALGENFNFVDNDAYRTVKTGMTPDEVLKLLGKPSGRTGNPSTSDQASWVWSRWPPGRIMVVEFSHGRTEEAFNE